MRVIQALREMLTTHELLIREMASKIFDFKITVMGPMACGSFHTKLLKTDETLGCFSNCRERTSTRPR